MIINDQKLPIYHFVNEIQKMIPNDHNDNK